MVSNEILLLKIIESNGSISSLQARGLSHAQISLLIENLLQQEYIVIDDLNISLSENGQCYLSNNLSKIFPKPKDAWILPQEHYYKKPLPFTTVVLPKGRKI